jgi:hypothetical protein
MLACLRTVAGSLIIQSSMPQSKTSNIVVLVFITTTKFSSVKLLTKKNMGRDGRNIWCSEKFRRIVHYFKAN